METESILSGHSEYGNRMQNGHRTTPRPLPPLKGNIMCTFFFYFSNAFCVQWNIKKFDALQNNLHLFTAFIHSSSNVIAVLFITYKMSIFTMQMDLCPKNMTKDCLSHLDSNRLIQCKMVCKKSSKFDTIKVGQKQWNPFFLAKIQLTRSKFKGLALKNNTFSSKACFIKNRTIVVYSYVL